MNISACSWIFGKMAIQDVFCFMEQSGFDEVEIAATTAMEQEKDIQNYLKTTSLKIGGMTGASSKNDVHGHLSHPNQDERQKAIESFQQQIATCARLGGRYLIICPSSVGVMDLPDNIESHWNRALDSVRQLIPVAEKYKIELVIEPINRYESLIVNRVQEAYHFAEQLNHPQVKILFDTFHANIEEVNFEDALENVFAKLHVVHLANNNRRGLTEGSLQFDIFLGKLQQLGYEGPLVFEMMATGPQPFVANKTKQAMGQLLKELEQSVQHIRTLINQKEE
ncbi:MAG TPA: sugar phosphate isomerase/epimerase family protein [Cerasibacillus sp.]|uniref:sugar phosphate isomerase/epimerase family protein n=1 Tax=Cerasibacillus sp. TaxID=2498711 RepID=UPI002F41858F